MFSVLPVYFDSLVWSNSMPFAGFLIHFVSAAAVLDLSCSLSVSSSIGVQYVRCYYRAVYSYLGLLLGLRRIWNLTDDSRYFMFMVPCIIIYSMK